jgi:hypothetical protein
MIIVGIDPGTTETAIIHFDGRVISYNAKLKNDEVLKHVCALDPSTHTVSCEHMQSFGMGVGAEVFETTYFIGRLWQCCVDRGIKWVRVFRMDVKMHHCHTTRAKDKNIRQALIDRFGKQGTKKAPGPTYGISGDEWSALAIASMTYDKKL